MIYVQMEWVFQWKEDDNRELSRRVTKYLIKTIRKCKEEDIKQEWNIP